MKPILSFLITAYRLLLSPWLGGGCRFYPSCSVYAEEALAEYPWPRAVTLIFCRLMQCHPWGGAGFDPAVKTHEIRTP